MVIDYSIIDLLKGIHVNFYMTYSSIHYRAATTHDIPAINRVVEQAVMTWPLAERIKKLSLNVLTYDYTDFAYYCCYVAVSKEKIVACVIWDPEQKEMLCHGLYVAPAYQSVGVGKSLLNYFYQAAKHGGSSAVLVKAERVSCDYFIKLGYQAVPVTSVNDYPYLYRKELKHVLSDKQPACSSL